MGARSVEIGKFRDGIFKASSFVLIAGGGLGIPLSAATVIHASVKAEKIPYATLTQDESDHVLKLTSQQNAGFLQDSTSKQSELDRYTVRLALGLSGIIISEVLIASGVIFNNRRRRAAISPNLPTEEI